MSSWWVWWVPYNKVSMKLVPHIPVISYQKAFHIDTQPSHKSNDCDCKCSGSNDWKIPIRHRWCNNLKIKPTLTLVMGRGSVCFREHCSLARNTCHSILVAKLSWIQSEGTSHMAYLQRIYKKLLEFIWNFWKLWQTSSIDRGSQKTLHRRMQMQIIR